MHRVVSLSVPFLLLAACAAPRPASPVRPDPVAIPAHRPDIVAPPLAGDWNDWPFTDGEWVYRRDAEGSIALFGPVGTNALLTLRCDRARGRLYLSLPGVDQAAMLRTSSMSRPLVLRSTGGVGGYVAVELIPTDAILDAMAFSRGRVVFERAAHAPLVVRPYAEIGRVIEDCR